ncbi:MAG: flagellar M-ring protein FliF C-terminal domain-containing protein [Planctomycetota bacterium]|nr:flagellar M-ring protein FliF C-terminal domain-containing protein [Planctomycetota bacterium]
MNQQLGNFFDALKGADAGTKVVIAVASAALIGTMAVVGLLAKDEHFVPVFPAVSNGDIPAVTKALADAGIRMELASGDGGNTVFVPRDQADNAKWAAFSAGAFTSTEKGILNGDASISSIFAGADEREQMTRAKEMEEIEHILEASDFIDFAEGYKRATTSTGFRGVARETASMVITTKHGRELTNGEKQAIRNIFQSALGMQPDEFSIVDQNGRMIHGGGDDQSGAFDDRVLELQNEYNQSEEQRIHRYFDDIYGPNLVKVILTSEFDTTQSTEVDRTVGDPVKVTGKNYTVKTPVGSTANPDGGGIAGASANVADGDGWGTENAAVVSPLGGAAGQMAETSETEETFAVPSTSTTTIRNQPMLKKLGVAVTIDKSLEDQKLQLEEQVKAMVRFDSSRSDTFSSKVATFHIPEVTEPAEGEGAAGAAPSGGLGMDALLERGVEIITALAFIFLLFKGLKSAKGSSVATAEGDLLAGASGEAELSEAEIDPEVLARAQVENLVTNNPERVAQILSNWVIEDRSAVKS